MRKGIIKKIIIGACASLLAMCAFGALSSVFANATCDHKWDDGKVTAVPTCQEAGEITYTCEKCEKQKVESYTTPAHVWTEGEVLKASTCKTHGEQEYFCAICGETDIRMISLTGHYYEELSDIEPTCIEQGVFVGACIYCGETSVTYYEPHEKVDNIGDDGLCDLCGYGLIEAYEGDWVYGKWIRIYRPKNHKENELDYNEIRITGNGVGLVAAELTYDDGAYRYYTINSDNGLEYSSCVNSAMRVVVTDEYIDFYMSAGVYSEEGSYWSLAVGSEDKLGVIACDTPVYFVYGVYDEVW